MSPKLYVACGSRAPSNKVGMRAGPGVKNRIWQTDPLACGAGRGGQRDILRNSSPEKLLVKDGARRVGVHTGDEDNIDGEKLRN